MECKSCGAQIEDSAKQCPYCNAAITRVMSGTIPSGNTTPTQMPVSPPSKISAGVWALLLGSLGVHKFILGYKTEGHIMLWFTILTGGAGAMIMAPIALIEGIIYLTKSDQEFINTYVLHKKPWF